MTDLETALLHLIVILPMAKGYASANPVGNNWKMVEEAYAFANELNERPAPAPTLADAAAREIVSNQALLSAISEGRINASEKSIAAIILRHFGHLSGHQQAAGAKYIPDKTPMTPFPKGTECDGAQIIYPPQ